MQHPAKQVVAALKLTRFSVAIGAIADIWLVLFITKSDSAYVGTSIYAVNWWPAIFATFIVAMGMCGFAASLNDTIDARHDATFKPARPIPSGWIPIAQAVVLLVCSLLIALLAASFLGGWPVRMGLLTAAAILFYNTVGKHVPAVGLVSVGLIYAAHMLIANIELTFILPVWLIMTHAMACAIFIYYLEAKRPRISFRGWMGILLGWFFWSIVLLSGPLAKDGLLPSDIHLIRLFLPCAAIIGFVALMRWKILGAKSNLIAAEKVRRYGALWECVYAVTWLVVLELYIPAIFMFCFALLSAIVMTLIKEAAGATGQPITWRA